MNKLLLIGDTTAGKSSVVNLLKLELSAVTSPVCSDLVVKEYEVNNNMLTDFVIIETPGLKDEKFHDSIAFNELNKFICDKECLTKIVFYIYDSSQPYVKNKTVNDVDVISTLIKKANSHDNYIKFYVILNKIDINSNNVHNFSDECIELSCHRNFIKSLIENQLIASINENFILDEFKKIIKVSNYVYNKRMLSNFKDKILNHDFLQPNEIDDYNEDEYSVENKDVNIFEIIKRTIKNIKKKKESMLQQELEECLDSYILFTKDNIIPFDEKKIKDKNKYIQEQQIILNILRIIKQLSVIDEENNDLMNDMIEKKVNNNYKLLFYLVGKNDINNIFDDTVLNMMNSITDFELYYRIYKELLTKNKDYDDFDKDRKLITHLLKYQNVYEELSNCDLPNDIKLFVKIANLPIKMLKVLINSEEVNEDYLSFLNDDNSILKLNYIVNTTNKNDNDKLRDEIINRINSEELVQFINLKDELDDLI